MILPTTISPTSPLYLGEGQVAQPVGASSRCPAHRAATASPERRGRGAAGRAGGGSRGPSHLVFSALTHTSLFTLSTAPATEAMSFSSST